MTIRCEAPKSDVIVVRIRVSTVVLGFLDAFARKIFILVEFVIVWPLLGPGLALFTARGHRRAAAVQASTRRRAAVFIPSCTFNQ